MDMVANSMKGERKSGEIKIGLITFYMLLSMKYPELKPHISELAQFIAKDLDLNASQVDEYQLLIWFNCGISRLEKMDFFSIIGFQELTTIYFWQDIISRLTENRVHLPDSFGSYKLFEWNIEPPPERFVDNLLLLDVVGPYLLGYSSAISCYVCIWSIIIWGMAYLEEGTIASYNPVDSVVTEQELQPLQN
ncbi:hypothetical protein BUALT_Bualt19G0059500 [Buddleja alternifolia]|uniref:Uncharacterized protein n=1 Tax=Buddleja alternifolia TaxID=168488 RepID=A0AAV6W9X0_9LAMI|nr:hypothetical protein BUALT_Bualt19G0059500 [Buddleja alternifolia]